MNHAPLPSLRFSLSSLRAIISHPLSSTAQVTLHILERPSLVYPPLSHTTAHSLAPSPDGKAGNIPTLEEWKTLWANWDLITMEMIPRRCCTRSRLICGTSVCFILGIYLRSFLFFFPFPSQWCMED